MSVTEEDVKHVAALARLGIDEARLASLATQLSTILGHMAVLDEIATDDVEADDLQSRGALSLRDDVGPQLKVARELSVFAPSTRDGFLLVPRLATHEEGPE